MILYCQRQHRQWAGLEILFLLLNDLMLSHVTSILGGAVFDQKSKTRCDYAVV
jgi:hypothetical protein